MHYEKLHYLINNKQESSQIATQKQFYQLLPT